MYGPSKIQALVLAVLLNIFAYAAEIHKVEPPFWYSCFSDDSLTLLLYGEALNEVKDISVEGPMQILDFKSNRSGSFLQIRTLSGSAGSSHFTLKLGLLKKPLSFSYKVRPDKKAVPRRIGPEDVMYLIMPDRFADGDPSNNSIPGHPDNVDREHKWGRHGGDLAGVEKHLDYLQESGFTSLWLTPVFENRYSHAYHGYTPSDLYAVDPHMGSLEDYVKLSHDLHSRSMTLVMDHIVNHISPSHPIAADPPSPDWLNGDLNNFHDCDYRISAVTDRWGDPEKGRYTQQGWFAGYLPDMNMASTEVQRYYIQNTLWWIQTAGLDGVRQDTWPYSDQQGMKNWAAAIMQEFPELYLLAEVWVDSPLLLSYFFSDSPRLDNSLVSVTDFPTGNTVKSLYSGRKSLRDLHGQLSHDHIYKDPDMMLNFLDNHDLPRFVSEKNLSLDSYLDALTLIYTLRGIPMLYYGNEIGLPGGHDPDNRKNFPGGFELHERSAFTEDGRTEEENRIYDRVTLLNGLRRDHPSLFQSQMHHSLPDEHCYIIQRSDAETQLLLVINTGPEARSLTAGDLAIPPAKSYVDLTQAEGAAGIKGLKALSADPLVQNKAAQSLDALSIPPASTKLFLSLPEAPE